MPDRKLNNTEFLGILPYSATCSACGKKFQITASGVHTVESAEKVLWEQFNAHTCEQAAQNSSQG